MKILEIDIETAPHSAYIWGLWTKYIAPDHIEIPGYTLCFAARWQGSDEVMFHSVWTDGLDGMVAAAWELLNEADAIIHYNGLKFDIKMLNTEFLLNGYVPPSPSHQMDLFPVVKKNFRFPSNKLDYVCKRLGIGEKIPHRGMDLWTEVMEGEKQSCQEMEDYNVQDVLLLSPLYEYLRPWMHNHPNYALYVDSDRPVCPHCGEATLVAQGYRTTKTAKYKRYQCSTCGTWSQSRYTEVTAEERHNILKTIPV